MLRRTRFWRRLEGLGEKLRGLSCEWMKGETAGGGLKGDCKVEEEGDEAEES